MWRLKSLTKLPPINTFYSSKVYTKYQDYFDYYIGAIFKWIKIGVKTWLMIQVVRKIKNYFIFEYDIYDAYTPEFVYIKLS